MDYINRVLTDIYKPVLPLFAEKVLSAAKLVNAELQSQIEKNKLNLFPTAQPTLRDFGPAMVAKELEFGNQYKVVQVATRYARVEHRQLYEFFIDFDISLFQKFKQLAATPEEGVTQEATLILHEALYLMGSMLGHKDSSATAFGLIPFLLAQETQKTILAFSRTTAVQFLKSQFTKYGINNYYFVRLIDEKKSINHQVNRHYEGSRQINQSLMQTEQQFENKFGFPADDRGTQTYLKMLSENLLKSADKTGAFILFSNLIEPKYNFIFDDLFIDTINQKMVQTDLCRNIVEQKSGLLGPKPYAAMMKLYDQALDYCN